MRFNPRDILEWHWKKKCEKSRWFDIGLINFNFRNFCIFVCFHWKATSGENDDCIFENFKPHPMRKTLALLGLKTCAPLLLSSQNLRNGGPSEWRTVTHQTTCKRRTASDCCCYYITCQYSCCKRLAFANWPIKALHVIAVLYLHG